MASSRCFASDTHDLFSNGGNGSPSKVALHTTRDLPMLRSSAALPFFGTTDVILSTTNEEAQSDDDRIPGRSQIP